MGLVSPLGMPRGEFVSQLHVVMAVFSLMIPGLMYIHYGRRVLRMDWIAIRTVELVIPYFVFLLFLAASAYVYEPDHWSPEDGGMPPPPPDSRSDFDKVYLLPLLPSAVAFYYFVVFGNVLVFGARREVVVKAVKVILGKYGWRYRMDGDRFTLRAQRMKIAINRTQRGTLVGIRWLTWNLKGSSRLRKGVMMTFTGRPSERPHPVLLAFGILLVVLGFVFGALLQ